jgi:hypothetical protein
VTETVELADWHIIIFANRRINRGEELSYDYKVAINKTHKKILMFLAPKKFIFFADWPIFGVFSRL